MRMRLLGKALYSEASKGFLYIIITETSVIILYSLGRHAYENQPNPIML